MNFPDSPVVGQTFSRGDYVWQYIGNNKWDLALVRGRGNLLTWITMWVGFSTYGVGGARGTKFFTFDAT